MSEVELLLVDGPAAGQRVRHHSDWATYMHVSYLCPACDEVLPADWDEP